MSRSLGPIKLTLILQHPFRWDELMTLLEGIKTLSPAGYQSMKTVIWGRIK